MRNVVRLRSISSCTPQDMGAALSCIDLETDRADAAMVNAHPELKNRHQDVTGSLGMLGSRLDPKFCRRRDELARLATKKSAGAARIAARGAAAPEENFWPG